MEAPPRLSVILLNPLICALPQVINSKNEALAMRQVKIIATEALAGKENDGLGSAYLALESPITMACRYESEPFWINERCLYPHPIVSG